jgi:pimeloyl-ACP methyl ester carboxylesterase
MNQRARHARCATLAGHARYATPTAAVLALCAALSACGGSRAPRSTVARDGNVEVGEVKALSKFGLSQVWGYTGMIAPALPAGGRTRARIFFLERYDPARTPVVFVYGMMGAPTQFESLVAGLDRSRFQPWIFHYRTGDRLDESAETLWRGLSLARRRFGARRVILVAHSMGGLVARRALNLWRDDIVGARAEQVPCLVTIASPLGGHPAAARGAEAPRGVPSWTDLAPGSAFLRALHTQPLPDSVRYFLVTATGQDGTTDGVVPVVNQRPSGALGEADQQSAYPTTHVAVLSDPALLHDVHAFLGQCPDR